eukprot:gene14979-20152_t
MKLTLLTLGNAYIMFQTACLEEFFAIGLGSFIGVGIRVLLSNEMAPQSIKYKTSIYGLFSDQTFLIPNFIGCFFMAIFVDSRVKSLFLNRKNTTSSTFKGCTIGFCGSLTTFSSWMNGVLTRCFTKVSWIELLVMLGVEFSLTWGAFLFGKLFIDTSFELYKVIRKRSNLTTEDIQSKDEDLDFYNNSIELVGSIRMSPYDRIHSQESINGEISLSSDACQLNSVEMALRNSGIINIDIGESDANKSSSISEFKISEPQNQQSNTSESFKHNNKQNSEKWMSCNCMLYAILFSVVSIVLFILFMVSTSQFARIGFGSVLFGPFGAWLRWIIAQNNFLKSYYPLLHLHTMLVNIFAVILYAILINNISSYNKEIFEMVDIGFNGACSTVSTFFHELDQLYSLHGALISLRYGCITFLVSIIAIQLILVIINTGSTCG